MYRVYQDDKPADCFHHNIIDKSWNNSLFKTKREAEIYAFHWCYPMGLEYAKKHAPKMELNKKYDYSMSEFPIWMMIKEEEIQDLTIQDFEKFKLGDLINYLLEIQKKHGSDLEIEFLMGNLYCSYSHEADDEYGKLSYINTNEYEHRVHQGLGKYKITQHKATKIQIDVYRKEN